MNHELPDVQAGFRKSRGTRDQIANICWIIGKAREFQKKISTSALLTMLKPLTVDHNKLENFSRDGNTRPPYLPLKKPVCRSGSNSSNWTWSNDWFQIGKGIRQGCILSPCLFNLYAEYIMRITGLEEAQAGIKIAGRN